MDRTQLIIQFLTLCVYNWECQPSRMYFESQKALVILSYSQTVGCFNEDSLSLEYSIFTAALLYEASTGGFKKK